MKIKVKHKLSKKGLKFLERNAERKANAECSGFFYEQKVPNKLKKTITMGLVCVLTVVGVLAGSVGTYKADNYGYRTWSIMVASPASSNYVDYVELYNSPRENYKWAVTAFKIPSGYGKVDLSSRDCTITMNAGNNVLTSIASKTFKVSGATNDYVTFQIKMSYDSYPTSFSGYVQLLQN